MKPDLPDSAPPQSTPATRDRLIAAMQDALRNKGYHGVGLSELLTKAQAPKGVLYHHFPGGKSELAVAAIEAVIHQLTAGLQRLMARDPDPARALATWMNNAQKVLAGSGFAEGCPLATIALESTPDDTQVRTALAQGFAAIRQSLTTTLHTAGIEGNRSAKLAALIVSAYEGALVQARVAGQVDAMRDTTDALVDLVHASLPPTPNRSTPNTQTP